MQLAVRFHPDFLTDVLRNLRVSHAAKDEVIDGPRVLLVELFEGGLIARSRQVHRTAQVGAIGKQRRRAKGLCGHRKTHFVIPPIKTRALDNPLTPRGSACVKPRRAGNANFYDGGNKTSLALGRAGNYFRAALALSAAPTASRSYR